MSSSLNVQRSAFSAIIVYYGVAFMSAKYFILSAFLLCCLISFLLGTSFGTVGTIGIVLIVLAKSGNVDVNMTAGAIIAGAYFGDRCSPMSSSANLIAALTTIAGAFPAAALSADAGFILYAFYLYLVPLTNLFTHNSKLS